MMSLLMVNQTLFKSSTTAFTAAFGSHVKMLEMCELAGPTHHLALGVGHHMNTLRKFSKISGIELIEIK